MSPTAHAQSVLRIRLLLVAVLVAVPIVVAVAIGAIPGVSVLWAVLAGAVLFAGSTLVTIWFHHVELPRSPTVPLAENEAPELFLLVRQLAMQLDVPAPTAVELSPDCDAWLEPRAHGAALIVGSPFLWWLRVTETRGLLAPVVAGSSFMAEPRVRQARCFVLRLDAVRARLAAHRTRSSYGDTGRYGVLERVGAWCQAHAEAMERAVAAQATARAQPVEPAGRVIAHEQVGLIATAWDRIISRLATPAWQAGYAPVALGAALVEALTELGQRDKLSHELSTRLTERPACDLLEEPGRLDADVSVLAAEVFACRHPAQRITWQDYVASVVEPDRRALAASAVERQELASLIAAFAKSGPDAPCERVSAAPRHLPDSVLTEAEATIECLAVDRGYAAWDLDWLDGVVIRRPDHTTVGTHAMLTRLLSGDVAGCWRELRGPRA